MRAPTGNIRHTLRPEADSKPKPAFGSLNVGVLVYGYAVLLGAAYILAYWRPFGFDIFPYLQLQDFLKFPLNRVVVLLLPPLLVALVYVRIDAFKSLSQGDRIPFYLLFWGYAIAYGRDLAIGIASLHFHAFHYDNEVSLLALSGIFFAVAAVLVWRIYNGATEIFFPIAAVVLVQSAYVVSTGYKNGKAVFNGAAEVFFLENRELCEAHGVRDWVYLGKFSEQAIFMNAIDKRMCFTKEMNFRLIPRKLKEGL